MASSKEIQNKYHGDQDWIFACAQKNFITWPKEWCMSYKWQIRDKQDLEVYNNKFRFKSVVNPKINSETSILVFHGDPKPHEIDDGVVVENWR